MMHTPMVELYIIVGGVVVYLAGGAALGWAIMQIAKAAEAAYKKWKRWRASQTD